jgi:very-short-patch-repair endonuclease
LVIEVDGSIHEKQKDYDDEKDFIINKLGYKILRFTNKEIESHLQQTLKAIINSIS